MQVRPRLKAETFRENRTRGPRCDTGGRYTEYNEATQGTSVTPRRKRRLANCPRLVHKIESHGSQYGFQVSGKLGNTK